MDSFYCLVRIILNKKLALYFFQYNLPQNFSSICFTGKSAKQVVQLLSLHSYYNLLSKSHLCYLSIELYKAELSIILNQMYIQD